ncbi:MAG: hypothetical protein KF849_05285 [Rhizobiaceae bacterium]|nr:hypothetical protein [Rhizobiaceae bacterium]
MIGADGSYTFTLNARRSRIRLRFRWSRRQGFAGLRLHMSDGDGDAVSGSLTVRVNDDTPTSPLAVTRRRHILDDGRRASSPVNAGGISPSTNYKTVSGAPARCSR